MAPRPILREPAARAIGGVFGALLVLIVGLALSLSREHSRLDQAQTERQQLRQQLIDIGETPVVPAVPQYVLVTPTPAPSVRARSTAVDRTTPRPSARATARSGTPAPRPSTPPPSRPPTTPPAPTPLLCPPAAVPAPCL